jgi:hypothetical protein
MYICAFNDAYPTHGVPAQNVEDSLLACIDVHSHPPTCRIHSLRDLKLTHLQKVTLKRTTAFAFHPTSSKSLVVAGDTQGVFGLWDIVS